MRTLTAIIILCLISIPLSAQDNTNTPSVEDLQQTATQLYLEQTATAEAASDEVVIEETSTPDEFELQATSLIQTATANAGGDGSQVAATQTPDDFELRATELVQTATAEALAPPEAQSDNSDGAAQPMNITLVAVGLVVTVLILIAIGYFTMASRANPKN